MYSLTLLLTFVSVWAFFARAKRVEFEKKGLTLYLSQRPKLSLGAAISGLVVAALLFIQLKGAAIGLLAGSIIFMILGSLVVLFAPFKKVSWVVPLSGFALCVLVEILIT